MRPVWVRMSTSVGASKARMFRAHMRREGDALWRATHSMCLRFDFATELCLLAGPVRIQPSMLCLVWPWQPYQPIHPYQP